MASPMPLCRSCGTEDVHANYCGSCQVSLCTRCSYQHFQSHYSSNAVWQETASPVSPRSPQSPQSPQTIDEEAAPPLPPRPGVHHQHSTDYFPPPPLPQRHSQQPSMQQSYQFAAPPNAIPDNTAQPDHGQKGSHTTGKIKAVLKHRTTRRVMKWGAVLTAAAIGIDALDVFEGGGDVSFDTGDTGDTGSTDTGPPTDQTPAPQAQLANNVDMQEAAQASIASWAPKQAMASMPGF